MWYVEWIFPIIWDLYIVVEKLCLCPSVAFRVWCVVSWLTLMSDGFMGNGIGTATRLAHEWKVDTVQGGSIHVWCHWLKLLVENSQTAKEIAITIMRILAYNRSCPKTVLDPVFYPRVPCTGLWRRQGTEARITRIVWLPYPIPVPMGTTDKYF